VPVGRLAILRAVPKSELVSAMAYLTVPALIGPVIGPVVGGFIVTFSSWRWIFFINVPVALLGLVLASRYIDNHREENVQPFDLTGFVLVAITLVGLMFGFVTAGRGMLPMPIVTALLSAGVVGLIVYALHARRTPHRIIDYTLVRLPTFRAALFGGIMFRSASGATPFLLPLMFQLGFGLSAFSSGLLTFMSAAGALTMKFTATPILRRFGFRNVLIANGVISAAFIGSYALFTPSTSHWLILIVLLAGGFFRSLEFTSLNTIAYAEITQPQMSRATTIMSVDRQFSTSLGVGLGALLLHLTMEARGGETLIASDFAPAFLCVGLLALVSIFLYLPLPADAGDEVSGRIQKP
jgi:MFS family permease